MPIPNQVNFQNNQPFDIDIEQIYNDYITNIDKIRSCYNANNIRDEIVAGIINKFDNPTIKDLRSALANLCDLNTFPQESRCHAFFRIIGFPCVNSNTSKIFNPGFSILQDPNSDITDTFKIGIIKDPITDFRKLSINRENYISSVNNIFNLQSTIDAGALSLSSGRHIRRFISPLNDVTFNQTDITTQQYKMDLSSSVGGINIDLTNYQDVDGNIPTKLGNFQFMHIIKPFFVDPIIDLTVNDATKLIGIPFVTSKEQLKVKDGSYVSRPMIEQIIRDRFIIQNPSETSGTANIDIVNYIKSVPDITDVNIVQQAINVYKLDDQTQFVKFLNIIQAMISKLIEAQQIIYNIQDNYYWVPVPSIMGPEGGSSVQNIFLSKNIDNDFITSKDAAIIVATLKNIINQTDSNAANATGTPDIGNFALPNVLALPNLGGSTTPDSLGNNIQDNLDSLTKKRTNDLTRANDALKTIEIIMGEFSGLGLCDIIAILGGLYLMPKNSLLGFLDEDAFNRIPDSVGVQGLSRVDITTASNDFIATVKNFYDLMDKIYQDMFQNNGLS